MASNHEVKSGFKSRRPRMRVIAPREIFRFQIPLPDEYQHMGEDDFLEFSQSESQFEDFPSSTIEDCSQTEDCSMKSNGSISQSESFEVDSVCESWSAHDIEVEYMDESVGTHDSEDGSEQESCELEQDEPCYSPEPPSPARPAFYFECRLCVKMAREPVVIPCGHMFCADCLDKWLHFFTDGTQCPDCKAKVSDSSIIPIRPGPLYKKDLLNMVPPRSNGGLCC